MPLPRPQVIVFDVIETIFSLSALEKRLIAAGLGPDALPLWFARLLREAFALEISGRFEIFHDVAKSALEVSMVEANVKTSPAMVDEVLSGFAELEAYSDVAPALRKLRKGGFRLTTLTNGGVKTTKALLAKAGLDGEFESVLSSEGAGHWKPAKQAYLYAANACGVEPERMMLVAAHSWDVQGAQAARLMTGWIPRRERTLSALAGKPDVQGETMIDVADALVALPSWGGRASQFNG